MSLNTNPDSPRQKMINLMYIVLMAMLALNVSSDVLNGFSLVDESLSRTTANSTVQNQSLYDGLAGANERNPEKIGPWFEKAVRVKNMSDSLYNYVDELKLRIVKEADGKNGDVANISNKEDLEAASFVMLTGNYYPFLIAYFILTCGLSFLETSCNPYILSMGDEATSTRRLNLAQSFNPMGSLLGMYVAMNFIQNRLNPMDTVERSQLSDTEFAAVRDSDLMVLIAPYLIIGLVILAMLIVIRMVKMPKNGDQSHNINFLPTLKRIFGIHHYREGVIAQFFYVGAQIMCWTFIIQYGTRYFMSEGMEEKAAEVLSQQYNIVAMIIFCASRFICTFILRYLSPGL